MNPQATNLPTIFNYNENPVRTITHDDGVIWFAAKDVCKSLAIAWQGTKSLTSLPEAWKL